MNAQEVGQAFCDYLRANDCGAYVSAEEIPETFQITSYDTNLHWGEVYELLYGGKPVEIAPDVSASLEKRFGGEGKGEIYYLIIRVEKLNEPAQFFKVDAYYASYDGVYWTEASFYEVAPHNVTVTEYRKI